MTEHENPPPIQTKAGFVNIIGKPNAGKSTLMNVLVGERMSIITHKPQTTRHRILGIVNQGNCQIVFSDTPGYVRNPAYKMHAAMNKTVEGTLEDADLLLFIFDSTEEVEEETPILEVLKKAESPMFLVLNKIDKITPEKLAEQRAWWTERFQFADVLEISATKMENSEDFVQKIVTYLPEAPWFYPEDQLTDRNERFFVSEIIREKLFLLYKDEIPYSCEVLIESFKETETKNLEEIVRISAIIFVLRESQKIILIGKAGKSIKQLGTDARLAIEEFLQKKVFLEVSVKVRKDWRDDEKTLERFGY